MDRNVGHLNTFLPVAISQSDRGDLNSDNNNNSSGVHLCHESSRQRFFFRAFFLLLSDTNRSSRRAVEPFEAADATLAQKDADLFGKKLTKRASFSRLQIYLFTQVQKKKNLSNPFDRKDIFSELVSSL